MTIIPYSIRKNFFLNTGKMYENFIKTKFVVKKFLNIEHIQE